MTYAAALAGPVAPFEPSGLLKLTALDTDTSESAVSSETVNRRISSEMSGPLSGTPDGITTHAQVNNAYLPAGNVLIISPFLFQVSVTAVPTWRRCGQHALTVLRPN